MSQTPPHTDGDPIRTAAPPMAGDRVFEDDPDDRRDVDDTASNDTGPDDTALDDTGPDDTDLDDTGFDDTGFDDTGFDEPDVGELAHDRPATGPVIPPTAAAPLLVDAPTPDGDLDPGGDPDPLDKDAEGTAAERITLAERWRARRIDGYMNRQERQRIRDEKWSRRYRKRRHRILPRTVIGTVLLLVALAVGAAFAGTVLYTWYDYRLQETQDAVDQFTNDFEERFQEASAQISRQREEAEVAIEERLVPLRELTEESTSTTELAAQVAPSLFFVSTLDEDGRASAGSAFVVGSDSSQSYFVTSYAVVQAAEREPGPAITLRAGDREFAATLWDWDATTDIAILTADEPDLPVLPWASQDLARNPIGTRIYAAGGLGSQGASVSPGLVIDVSAAGLQYTAAVGTAYRGGPILTGDGEVLGVVSLSYAPLNFDPAGVPFGPNIVAACDMLDCSGRIPGLQAEAEEDAGESGTGEADEPVGDEPTDGADDTAG